MNEPVPRFEFRLFGQCFEREEQMLRSLAPCNDISESREIYLLGHSGAGERNLKIRNDKLELKRLVDLRYDLQRWRPAGQWEFPVPHDVVDELLGVSGSGNREPAPLPVLSLHTLLRFVAQATVPIYRANVLKRRWQFSPPGCQAEVDQLLVNGAAIASLALESGDPHALQELRASLRLEDRENVAYPLALSRIMGLSPLPREDDYG